MPRPRTPTTATGSASPLPLRAATGAAALACAEGVTVPARTALNSAESRRKSRRLIERIQEPPARAERERLLIDTVAGLLLWGQSWLGGISSPSVSRRTAWATPAARARRRQNSSHSLRCNGMFSCCEGRRSPGLDVRTLSSRLMNANTETTLVPTAPAPVDTAALETGSDRRTDIDAKMTLVAGLLKEVGCDGLLLLDPDNFAWLTAGATARGILDPREHPATYCNGEQRWVLCSNLDSQRMFDEEVSELGFQLKEWPYHWGRDQLLADLCQGRRVACDQPLGECKVVGEELRLLRRRLTVYEQACLEAVGGLVSHALEATCRTMQPGITERELAAQVS